MTPASAPCSVAFRSALEDQVLGVRDLVRLLGGRVALDPEHLLLERPAVVEREDVEHAVVAECHRFSFVSNNPLYTPFAAECSGYDGRVEHRFTGPSYTLGIEEELMIVDDETLDLSSSIEALLEDLSDVTTEGEVKPELMESVCEIATTPVRNTAEAGRPAARSAPHRPAGGPAARALDRLGRHAPVRALGGPARRRPLALPRPDLGPPVRGAPGDHLRHPRARRASTTPTRRST